MITTYTIEVVLKRRDAVVESRTVTEWQAPDTKASAQTAYDWLLRAARTATGLFELMDDER